MNEQQRIEHKRQQARERQRAKRVRDRKKRAAMQSSVLHLELYKGTREALERICAAGEFEEPAELLTLMIHRLDELQQRDPSRFSELTAVRCHA